MSESVAAPAAPATGTTAPAGGAAADTPKTAEDFFELMLDGAEKPVKVPVSKVPVDKINPHLAKHRAEADRRMSEADRREKSLAEKEGRVAGIEKLVARLKEEPALLEKLAEELGLTPDQLDAMSERRISQRIKAQMQAEEESKDPAKKSAREEREELERTREENEKLKKERAAEAHAQVKARIEGGITAALDRLPVPLRGPQAAQEMVAYIRAALDDATTKLGRQAKLDDLTLTVDDLAKAARDALRGHARVVYDADEEIEFTPAQLKRAAAVLAKQGAEQHPSASGANPKGKGAPPRTKSEGNAGDLMLRLLRTH